MNEGTLCAVVRDLLPSYLDGITSPESSEFIRRHLAECGACRAVMKQMSGVVTPAESARTEMLSALRRARLRRKWGIVAVCLALILAAAMCLLPLPRSVSLEASALRWYAGAPEKGTERVGVSVHGVYLDYLFHQDVFSGDIAIEGIGLSRREGAMSPLRMERVGASPLAYMDGKGFLKTVGFLVAKPGMTSFLIGVYDAQSNWSGDGGEVLTWPASTREEAAEVTRRLVRGNSWLGESVWEGGKTREEWDADHVARAPSQTTSQASTP